MLRNFVAVAALGNLNDAADRLGRAPSAVSMSLKQLEEHLGAPLFASDRKNRLTALGRFTLAEGSRETTSPLTVDPRLGNAKAAIQRLKRL
jgi:DNA-binding transcriptional LysR family regulator